MGSFADEQSKTDSHDKVRDKKGKKIRPRLRMSAGKAMGFASAARVPWPNRFGLRNNASRSNLLCTQGIPELRYRCVRNDDVLLPFIIEWIQIHIHYFVQYINYQNV